MPTLREMIERMIEIEKQSDDEPGAYPIWFKDDFTKVKFILLLKIHKLTTSLPRFKIKKRK